MCVYDIFFSNMFIILSDSEKTRKDIYIYLYNRLSPYSTRKKRLLFAQKQYKAYLI